MDDKVIGKVINAKGDKDSLTIKIAPAPFVDIRKIFDDFYNRGVRPFVSVRDNSVDYTKMYSGKPSIGRERMGYFLPHDVIYVGNLGECIESIVGIYVNRKKDIVAVKWNDDVVTKVHRRKGDKFDLEAAVNAAIVKRLLVSSHTDYQKKIEAIAEYQN